ncbi:hypothetical protein ABH908_000370 [Pseudomonas frederiksbergensis]
MKFKAGKTGMPTQAVYVAKAIVPIALVCFVALSALTIVAIDRSRDRTACYRAAQTPEECTTPSWWEDILRRTMGSSG